VGALGLVWQSIQTACGERQDLRCGFKGSLQYEHFNRKGGEQ